MEKLTSLYKGSGANSASDTLVSENLGESK